MIIRPAKRIRGRLTLPGDKSISHRAALIACLANGTSRIENYSGSEDCAATLSCLRKLGVRIEQNGHDLTVEGSGMRGLRKPDGPLDCRNSGTTIRLLAGILAGQNFDSTLTGDDSLRTRPMQRIIEPLELMGARISSQDGRPPLTVHGTPSLKAIDYELLVASAQVKSSILLAGLNAQGETTVIENAVTRDHTERLLRLFGVAVNTGKAAREGANARFASVSGDASFAAHDVVVPGDVSSAAYFIAASALLAGSSLEVAGVGVNPTRIAFIKTLEELGFEVEIDGVREESLEPVGDIRVRGNPESERPETPVPMIVDGLLIPQLIDELPLLAVVGSQLSSGIEIRDARELRVKESDRIATTAQNLRAMGAEVEEFEDGLRVAGKARLRGAKINPGGDHRIAMAFSIAALLAEGETEISDAGCVNVSFPEFFDLLNAVVERA